MTARVHTIFDVTDEIATLTLNRPEAKNALSLEMRDELGFVLNECRKRAGKDIKALVLLSPEQNFKGITLSGALKHPVIKDHLSYLIAYGDRNSSKNRRDAESLYNSLKQKRAEYETPEEIIDKKDLFDQSYKTSFQGTKMLGKDLGVEKHITNFIKLRLQDKSFPWAERKNPFES